MIHGAIRMCVLALLLCGPVAGGAEDLIVNIVPQVPQPRSGAPLNAVLTVQNRSEGLRRGALRLVFRDGQETLKVLRTGELVLPRGNQKYRLTLPPLESMALQMPLEVRVSLLTENGERPLPPAVLAAPTANARAFVVAVIAPDWSMGADVRSMATNLALEKYLPRREDDPPPLRTSVPMVSPDELPTQPLRYCCYDIVLLTDQGLRQADDARLEALARWTRAGGSLLVAPDVAAPLGTEQTEFLKEVAGGNWPPTDGASQETLRRSCGLGHVVVAPPGAANDDEWRRTVAFLWRLRAEQARSLVQTGYCRDDRAEAPPVRTPYVTIERTRPDRLDAAHVANPAGGPIIEALMPRDVRILPFGVILAVLLAFLLLVGPADYFVLGMLGRRKLTWILFPAVSLGITLCMVLLAESYMTGAGGTRSLVVADVDRQGEVTRWTRYSLALRGRGSAQAEEFRQCLHDRVPVDEYARWDYTYRGQRGSLMTSEPPLYEGNIPAHFRVHQYIQQWSPVVTRTMSFEPLELPHNLRWNALVAADLSGAAPMREIVRKLTEGTDFGGRLVVMNGDRSSVVLPSGYRYRPDSGDRDDIAGALDELFGPEPYGVFSVVRALSPAGAGNFEDLALLDPQDPGQWLVAAIEEQGDEIFVVRHLYDGGE
jgi:hypothetical protein